MPAVINKETCINCKICMNSCMSEAIDFGPAGVTIDADKCDDCEFCIDACPNGSISMQ